MGWRSRVLLGRVRDQATVLATVTLVTFVATTLLGTFAFLLDVTGEEAVDAALERVPASAVALDTTIRVNNKDAGRALEAADATVAGTLGDIPAERTTWLTGRMWSLPRAGGNPQAPIAYPASIPLLPEQGELVTGTWPDRARDDAGHLQVNVPAVAAGRYGWTVGTAVPVATLGRQLEDTWVVVGTHRLTGASSSWARDPLRGTSHDPAHPVPGSMGNAVTEAWGPMVVTPDALLGTGVTQYAYLTVAPDLTAAGPDDLTAAYESLDSYQVRLSAALSAAGVSGHVRTSLGDTIDAAWRELAVTRIGVVVVGLLLVVLSTTVMLLAARLLSERRAAEGELVAARGASPAQLRSLAVLEAVTLAAVTAAVAPWAARAVFERLTTSAGLTAAGLEAPAGIPVAVHLACTGVAVVLAVALVVPSWHTSGSSSVAAHAGLVRTGADVALLAVGAVALWQLLDYGAPLTRDDGGVRLDPVLVLGPALVALAAAVLALRLVAPVGRGADALARRSRSLVAPLAAWQVARRPASATGTTLVVVLAVATATFSHAFLTTWRTSQLEQVDLALGADARVDGVRGERLTLSGEARAAFADAPDDALLQAVTNRPVPVGRTVGGTGGAIEAQLVAVDTRHGDALRGRSDVPWATRVAPLAPPAAGDVGSPLPGDPHWLVTTVTAESRPSASGTMYLGVAVEDDAGVQAWLGGPELEIGSTTTIAMEVPPAHGPLRVVAVSAVVALAEAPFEAVTSTGSDRGQLGNIGVALQDVRVLDRSADVPSATDAVDAAAGRGTPVTLDGTGWEGAATSGNVPRGVVTDPAEVDALRGAEVTPGAFVAEGIFDMVDVASTNGRFAVHAWPAGSATPVLVSSALARRADLHQRNVFWAEVGGARVPLRIEGIVPYLPGAPRGPAILADRDALTRAVVGAGGTDAMVDGWWLTASGTDAPGLTAAVATAVDGDGTTRGAERAAAVAGPLRVGVPAALSLVGAATGVLVLVGLGASAAAAVRSRRLELARLQALGAHRRSLVVGLLGEHALLVVLGALAGLGIGYGLTRAVAPVLTVSGDGRRPVPPPVAAWDDVAALATTGGLVLAACVVVAVLAALLVRRASGALLRLGDDR